MGSSSRRNYKANIRVILIDVERHDTSRESRDRPATFGISGEVCPPRTARRGNDAANGNDTPVYEINERQFAGWTSVIGNLSSRLDSTKLI